jgi:hypothetical protein
MAVGNVIGFSAGASGNWHKYVVLSVILCLHYPEIIFNSWLMPLSGTNQTYAS